MTRRLLLVWHSRTGLARRMADALEHGAHEAASKMDSTLDVVRRPAREATIEDLLGADGYLFCAPENLATVSGEFLEFCHRSYYHVFACEGSGSSYGETSQLFGRPCELSPCICA